MSASSKCGPWLPSGSNALLAPHPAGLRSWVTGSIFALMPLCWSFSLSFRLWYLGSASFLQFTHSGLAFALWLFLCLSLFFSDGVIFTSFSDSCDWNDDQVLLSVPAIGKLRYSSLCRKVSSYVWCLLIVYYVEGAFFDTDRLVIDLSCKIVCGGLYTAARMASFGSDFCTSCFCGAVTQTLEHLFFYSSLSRSVFSWF